MPLSSVPFTYNKQKVIQALRYHFISRPEIKVMIILVNVFAITAAALYYFNKVTPMAFMISSFLWVILMLAFWFFLPYSIYKTNKTFKDSFTAILSDGEYAIRNENGSRSWQWNEFSTYIESPHFFHLYFNPRSFFLLPKGAFPGESVNEARQIFRNKIGK